MASLRRPKTFMPDGQTAKFLYTILKQLDLKQVNWTEVAEALEISNGHAARMRYSRLKQQIEGVPTQPRASRAKKLGDKDGGHKAGGKRNRTEDDLVNDAMDEEDGPDVKRIKCEDPSGSLLGYLSVAPECSLNIPTQFIKPEPGTEHGTTAAFNDQPLPEAPQQFPSTINPTQLRSAATAAARSTQTSNMIPSMPLQACSPPYQNVNMANLQFSFDNTAGLHCQYGAPLPASNLVSHQHMQHYYSPYPMSEMMYAPPVKREPNSDEHTRRF